MQYSVLLALLPLAYALPQGSTAASALEVQAVETPVVEARVVEVQARGLFDDDECSAERDVCKERCDDYLWPKGIPHPCADECVKTYKTCKANSKRSIEDTLIEARNNHAEEITDCYDDVADCKAKGGSIADCYAPLNGCLWSLFQKYGKRSE
ncbi:hypothetical protein GGI35DRAFT_486832 [Trichoderma velutinum]